MAEGGTLEKYLDSDGKHEPDCSTDTHVTEADFGDKADKPGEGVDQVKRYMNHDPEKRKGGILLILENDKKRYIQKLCEVMEEKDVTADIWIMYSDFTYQSYQCKGGAIWTSQEVEDCGRAHRRISGRGSQGTVQCACCGAGPGSSNLGPGSGAINRGLEQDVLDSLSGFPIKNVGNDRGSGPGGWGLEIFRFRFFASPACACPHADRLRTVREKARESMESDTGSF